MLKINDKVELSDEIAMKELSQLRKSGKWVIIHKSTNKIKFIGNEQDAKNFLSGKAGHKFNLLSSLITVKITKQEIAEYEKIQNQIVKGWQ